MTPIFESTISRNQSDTYYSRMMWVKTPTEILAGPRDKPGQDRCLIKHQGLYIFGGYNKNRECSSNKLYLIKPSYNFNKHFMSAKNGAWKKNVKPRFTFEITEVPCLGG